ncbi:Anaphase-promoting complex subunit 2 [Melia azedarach]|uniref:Anaphase-promoting complex subunit 2 n=1 Tax=Melia azedarach TaxID=155640 RepID=A0ACC1XQB9_MELAZ|nr:Anaphase-promoting complex subunit 2 [Melia azedarach]
MKVIPLQFLNVLLAYLGESVSYRSPTAGLKSPLASLLSSYYPGTDTPSEGLIRWQLQLEYCAYETLQDLRIAKLFEIIVDYPESTKVSFEHHRCLNQ